MSTLYSIRKKIGANPLVVSTIKKPYMALKNYCLRKSAKEELGRDCRIVRGEDRVIFYLDIPTHPNMGDLAQYCCISQWLLSNYPEYTVIEISAETALHAEKEFLSLLRDNDADKNLIFFQSGYCTQDLGGTHDEIHKMVVKTIKNIPIIMLPQTILYKSKERAQQTAEIYKKNKKLMLLCRDAVSYDMAQSIFPTNRLEQYPDIVTSLIGTKDVPGGVDRKGILICCRNDIERFYSDEEIAAFKKELEKIDPVTISDTTVQVDYRTLKADVEGFVNQMISEFSHYRVVITDRYHGTIFSLVAGTPVIVIKSNDHKVTTGVDWFKGIYDENVCHIHDIKMVPDKVQAIYRNFTYQKLSSYFQEEYYSRLKGLIEDWRRS